jgi:hypothetical protein
MNDPESHMTIVETIDTAPTVTPCISPLADTSSFEFECSRMDIVLGRSFFHIVEPQPQLVNVTAQTASAALLSQWRGLNVSIETIQWISLRLFELLDDSDSQLLLVQSDPSALIALLHNIFTDLCNTSGRIKLDNSMIELSHGFTEAVRTLLATTAHADDYLTRLADTLLAPSLVNKCWNQCAENTVHLAQWYVQNDTTSDGSLHSLKSLIHSIRDQGFIGQGCVQVTPTYSPRLRRNVTAPLAYIPSPTGMRFETISSSSSFEYAMGSSQDSLDSIDSRTFKDSDSDNESTLGARPALLRPARSTAICLLDILDNVDYMLQTDGLMLYTSFYTSLKAKGDQREKLLGMNVELFKCGPSAMAAMCVQHIRALISMVSPTHPTQCTTPDTTSLTSVPNFQ